MTGPLSLRVQAEIIVHRTPVNYPYFSVSLNNCQFFARRRAIVSSRVRRVDHGDKSCERGQTGD
jgi:hypothetical protein